MAIPQLSDFKFEKTLAVELTRDGDVVLELPPEVALSSQNWNFSHGPTCSARALSIPYPWSTGK